MGEDGADGSGVGDEGDDAHGSAARRAEEREDVVDAGHEGGPARLFRRRPLVLVTIQRSRSESSTSLTLMDLPEGHTNANSM